MHFSRFSCIHLFKLLEPHCLTVRENLATAALLFRYIHMYTRTHTHTHTHMYEVRTTSEREREMTTSFSLRLERKKGSMKEKMEEKSGQKEGADDKCTRRKEEQPGEESKIICFSCLPDISRSPCLLFGQRERQTCLMHIFSRPGIPSSFRHLTGIFASLTEPL